MDTPDAVHMDNDDYHDYALGFVLRWLDQAPDHLWFSGNTFWAAGLRKHGNGRRLGRVLRELEDAGIIQRCGDTLSIEGHFTRIATYRRPW